MRVITGCNTYQLIPAVPDDAHKYSRGLCELVVGSGTYPGAAVLACRAANLMGAGYIKAYTVDAAAAALHVLQPSSVCIDQAQYVRYSHISAPHKPTATVIGCGMTPDATPFVLHVLAITQAPVVVDGGALMALTDPAAPEILAARAQQQLTTIITPHAGEAERMVAALEPLHEEAERCLELAKHYHAICVLKGSDTYIAAADMELADVCVACEGSSVLARAGTGDVLAGMIGALLAQGVSGREAAQLGVVAHAWAGAEAYRAYGMCATTEHIVEAIPQAMRALVDVGTESSE